MKNKTFKNLAAANDEIRRLIRADVKSKHDYPIDTRDNYGGHIGCIRLLIGPKVFDIYYKTTKAERVSYAKKTNEKAY